MIAAKFQKYGLADKNLILTLITLALLLKQSSAQQIRTGTCQYHFDSENRYTCRLINVDLRYSNETLKIDGDHLQDQTDSSVVSIFAVNSTIRYFNGEITRKFINLVYVDMSEVSLRFIAADAFENCQKLRELLFVSNSILELKMQLFGKCENLVHLDISNNEVLKISNEIFGKTNKLEVFKAGGNEINEISEDIFHNMTNLRVFNVYNNYLSELSTNLLKNSLELEEYDISFNFLHFDEAQIAEIINGLSNLKILKGISASSNINFTIFAQFEHLKELSISSEESLVNIAWNFLPVTLNKLEICRIGNPIPSNAFNRLENLSKLSISSTGIKILSPNIFVNLYNLEDLEITKMDLSELHPELLANQSKLLFLRMTYCNIKDLPFNLFSSLKNLNYCDLSYNSIHTLNSNAFGIHRNLTFLNFQANSIEKIERGFFKNFEDKLSIDLRINVCVDKEFENNENLDVHEDLQQCYVQNETTTPEATTTDGVGEIWSKFQMIYLVFIGLVTISINS